MDKTPKDLSPPALAKLIEDIAVESCKTWATWPGLELHQERDIIFTLSHIPYPSFNAVLRARIFPLQVEERIDSILALAKEHNVPLMWFVTPFTRPANLWSYLLPRGFVFEGVTGMAADLEEMGEEAPVSGPEDLVVVEVRDLMSFRAWCQVMTPAFEIPEFASQAWFQMFSALGFDGQWRHYLAFLEGKPVGTSSLFLGSDGNGLAVENVATLPEYRQKGIGAAVTWKALKEGRREGYRIATICASEMGIGVYRKLGFREVCQMGMYLWTEE